MPATRTPDRLAEVAVQASPAALPVARRRPRLRAQQAALYLVLAVGIFVALAQLIWAVFGSFKAYKELMESHAFLPSTWTLDAYQYVLGMSGLWYGFRNTVIVSLGVTGVSVATSTMAGYVFAKYQFPGRDLLFLLLLVTLMVPLYLTISSLGVVRQSGRRDRDRFLPRTVAVEDVNSGRPIEVLDDAATILRRIIELPDPYVNMGARLLRHAVWRTYDRVGDGGATAAVLLQAIVHHVEPCIAAGGDALLVRTHLQRGLALVMRALREQGRPLRGPEDIANVALTLCHDPDLAKMLGEILDIIGPDGCLLVEDGYTPGLSRQYVEGVHWNVGYVSPYFITDDDKQEVRLAGPLLLISDLRLTRADELLPCLTGWWPHTARPCWSSRTK
jgi:SAM-dependent methyltransferase